MDNIFRLLRRNSKQIFSFMLAFVVFIENPLTALASPTTNESFNITSFLTLYIKIQKIFLEYSLPLFCSEQSAMMP